MRQYICCREREQVLLPYTLLTHYTLRFLSPLLNEATGARIFAIKEFLGGWWLLELYTIDGEKHD